MVDVAETSQRYIVRELEGYPIGPYASHSGSAKLTTDVMVLDRWDSHHVVAFYAPSNGLGPNRLDQRRLTAQAQARSLEQDNRRWLRSAV
jgi:hypothetical protein